MNGVVGKKNLYEDVENDTEMHVWFRVNETKLEITQH